MLDWTSPVRIDLPFMQCVDGYRCTGGHAPQSDDKFQEQIVDCRFPRRMVSLFIPGGVGALRKDLLPGQTARYCGILPSPGSYRAVLVVLSPPYIFLVKSPLQQQ